MIISPRGLDWSLFALLVKGNAALRSIYTHVLLNGLLMLVHTEWVQVDDDSF